MNRLSIAIFVFVLLVGCQERKDDAAEKPLKNLQEKTAGNTNKEKLLKHYDSMQSQYGDSLTYVSDIFIKTTDSSK